MSLKSKNVLESWPEGGNWTQFPPEISKLGTGLKIRGLHPKIQPTRTKKTSNYSDGWFTRPYRATNEQYVLYELENLKYNIYKLGIHYIT